MIVQKAQHWISLLVVAAIAVLCLPLFDMVYLYPSATSLMMQKAREDAEHLGLFFAEELKNNKDHQLSLQQFKKMVDSFDLIQATLRTPTGRLIFSTSEQIKQNRKLSTLSLLKQGKTFSRMFVAALPDRNEPISLVEIQTPVMYENKLEEVLILTQDISSIRASLDQVVSRSALFLFSVATVFLVIIVLIAQMARKVIKKQNYSEQQLTESRQQLEKKHRELEQLFDLVEQAKYEWQVALDCISDMILLTDEAGRVRRCNQAFIRFIGCSYLEVLGKNWQQVLLRGNTKIISLDQQNNQIYHQQNRVWLQLEFYPYAAEQGEKLTVIKIQQQDQNNPRKVIENIKKAQ